MKKDLKKKKLSQKEGYDRLIESIMKTSYDYCNSNEKILKELKKVALKLNQNSICGKLTTVQLYCILTERMMREVLYMKNLIFVLKNKDKRLNLKLEESGFILPLYKLLKESPRFKNKADFLANVVKFFKLSEKFRYVLANVDCRDMLPELTKEIPEQFEKVSEFFSIISKKMKSDYVKLIMPPSLK
jgi:hypothetical protein